MKLRLTGLLEECIELVEAMQEAPRLQIVEVSEFYPNRGESLLGRLYVEVRLVRIVDGMVVDEAVDGAPPASRTRRLGNSQRRLPDWDSES